MDMKKNVIKINESQLKKIVAESVKKVLKEDYADKLINMNDDDFDFESCLEEITTFVENLEKEYRPEIVSAAINKLVECYNSF